MESHPSGGWTERHAAAPPSPGWAQVPRPQKAEGSLVFPNYAAWKLQESNGQDPSPTLRFKFHGRPGAGIHGEGQSKEAKGYPSLLPNGNGGVSDCSLGDWKLSFLKTFRNEQNTTLDEEQIKPLFRIEQSA